MGEDVTQLQGSWREWQHSAFSLKSDVLCQVGIQPSSWLIHAGEEPEQANQYSNCVFNEL